jgi:hypothetical protein
MSDELKDFRYYADKAEHLLIGTAQVIEESLRSAETLIAMAAVYAELAKAAPKTEPEPALPCNVGLHGYREGMYDGTSRPCIFAKGHAGLHQTNDGVSFRGLDNADFPGPEDS